MSQSPTLPGIGSSDENYVDAWRHINELLKRGLTFSGRERNCCFLNTRQGRFANVSAVSGFDFADDSRAVATVDWDRDGDLDVWTTNRTAPRVRFLRNNLPAKGNYVALRLVGTAERCNRDAIGARVNVTLAGPEQTKLVKSLRAGEGYLSQSSKWLHFGLGKSTSIEKLVVRWPSGDVESFPAPKTNQRYVLVQGTGQARPQPVESDDPQLTLSQSDVRSSDLQTQNLLSRRVPLPPLQYTTFEGERADISSTQTPLLINLWSTSCQPCIREMTDLVKHQKKLTDSGLGVVLLCVDDISIESNANTQEVRQLIRQLQVPFPSGMTSPDFFAKLQIVHNALYDHHRPLPVPTSLLIDSLGQLAALYKVTRFRRAYLA